jgi:hypothetical protein
MGSLFSIWLCQVVALKSVPYRYYFAKKFDHIVAAEMASRAAQKLDSTSEVAVRAWPHRLTTLFRRRPALSTVVEATEDEEEHRNKGPRGGIIEKLRPDMIRRMDDAPKLVDPNGWISEGQTIPLNQMSPTDSNGQPAFTDDKSLASPSTSPLHQAPEKYSAEEENTGPIHPKTLYVMVLLNYYVTMQ